MEAPRRDSLIDEKARQLRVQEVALRAWLFRLRGALLMVLLFVRTPLMLSLVQSEPVSGNRTHHNMLIVGALRLRFASLTTLLYILLYIGDNWMSFFGVG